MSSAEIISIGQDTDQSRVQFGVIEPSRAMRVDLTDYEEVGDSPAETRLLVSGVYRGAGITFDDQGNAVGFEQGWGSGVTGKLFMDHVVRPPMSRDRRVAAVAAFAAAAWTVFEKNEALVEALQTYPATVEAAVAAAINDPSL